ncbi:hypothetical protein QCE73_00110 [Caballeronia sp. LZ029]|nr:hypothetical protein [Caballeronia sp. LZ029]MDR5741551.1 hypothetical protein [Caballeronia sp. LZ029]
MTTTSGLQPRATRSAAAQVRRRMALVASTIAIAIAAATAVLTVIHH